MSNGCNEHPDFCPQPRQGSLEAEEAALGLARRGKERGSFLDPGALNFGIVASWRDREGPSPGCHGIEVLLPQAGI